VVEGGHEDPPVVAKDMVAGLAVLAVVDTEAAAVRELVQGTTASVPGYSHLASHHSAYYRFAHTHSVEDVEGRAAASRPASWKLARTLSVCEADSSEEEEEETWTRPWSVTDQGEGPRQKCWRRQHLVGNSRHAQTHRDEAH
jgi:hypothetical protein